MNLKKCAFTALMTLATVSNSYASDPFAELDQEVKKLSVDHSAEFEKWYAAHLKEFNQWQKVYLKEWDEKQKSSIEKWGDTQIPAPDRVVVYNDEKASRTVVDLEKGEITISFLASDKNSSKTPQEQADSVNQVIESQTKLWEDVGVAKPESAQVEAVKVEKAKIDKSVIEEVKQEIEAQTERQMSQLDMFVEKTPITVSEIQKQQAIQEQKSHMQHQKVQRLSKVEQVLKEKQQSMQRAPLMRVSYTVKIPDSSLANRANKYLPKIQVEAAKRELPPSLVLAIMHEESHFNPKAKSHVPAYGLMQIVPTSAGHDVNRLYHGKDKPMKASDLYDPQVNIETGTAYLKILESRYLRGIKDPKSATYSIIAAYNTGSGNVAKAFGERSVSKAIKKINSMSSDEVYQKLIKNLPYNETRNYLKKVNDRLQTYREQSPHTII